MFLYLSLVRKTYDNEQEKNVQPYSHQIRLALGPRLFKRLSRLGEGLVTDDRKIITARQVAQQAGVSQSVVSRAFTPGARISDATRRRVIEAAARLGYRPNIFARSLTLGRSNIVGVGVGNLNNPFFADSLERLSVGLDRLGLRVLLFPADLSGPSVKPAIREVLDYRLTALVLLSVGVSPALSAECHKADIPLVLFNRTSDDSGASSVVTDDEGGARAIAAYLLATGHRRIAFLAGTDMSSTSALREKGLCEYLHEHGAAQPIRACGNFEIAQAASAVRRLLTDKEPPDAIFCANDVMAIAAINVARFEFGLMVGREISIIGFGDIEMAAWPAFSLTTFSQPVGTMVQRTIDIIEALRKDPAMRVLHMVPGELKLRGSSRPVTSTP